MKVILSVEALAPALTGIGRYSWELASRLPLVLGEDAVRYYLNGRWIEDPGRLLSGGAKPAAKRRWPLPTAPRWLRRRLMEHSCRGQVFHGPNYFIPPCADIGVATVHDLSVFKFPETHPAERIRHFEQEFKRSMDRATHLITDCEAIRREVMDFLGWPAEKITAVPLGVSSAFNAAPDGQALAAALAGHQLTPGGYALCVSTLEPRKKIDCLLRAYRGLPAALRGQYPLVLAGAAGWRNDALRQDIERAAGEGWLRPLGFVAEKDLPSLYAGARLFVYPSIYEGFGLPVLEAMACGVPVVASNCSSLPEVAGGSAWLVAPDDHEALLEGILKGLADEAWRSYAQTAGLRQAGDYTWDQCVEKTVAVYRHALSQC